MKINLKKLIKISAVLAVSAATLISCSSDSEEGMLRTIVNSQEEASYTISKSSFVYDDTDPESSYFVSVEDDGIYRAMYTSEDDDADSNILDNVQRDLYTNTSDLTQIQSIYTDGTTSYVVYTEADSSTDSTSTTKLYSFDNSDLSSDLTKIDLDDLTGTFKNLTPNGYIITTDFDEDAETASLYIYSLDKVKNNTSGSKPDYIVKLDNIYSEYGSSRYLDYCVYYDNTTKNIESPTAYGTADGLIISLTDSDDDNDDYVAEDRYFYFSNDDLTNTFSNTDLLVDYDNDDDSYDNSGYTDASTYAFYIDADDDDDDAVNSAVVAAHGDAEGANALIITSNGNAYSGDIDDALNELDDRWDNSDNSDTFAVHLPSLFFNNDTNLYSDNSTDYLIGMNSYDYIYVYYADSDDDRYSTSSDIDVEYADDLNSSSDIIYIAPVESSDDVDTYWVATADNGYFTMTIDTTGIIEDSDSHSITEGFTYSGDTSD